MPEQGARWGLRAEIIRGGNHSPGEGISRDPGLRFVYIVGEGVPVSHPIPEDAPTLVLGEIGGHVHARPEHPAPPGLHGYMMSGAWVVHSSSFDEWVRHFGHRLPIPLHDSLWGKEDASE